MRLDLILRQTLKLKPGVRAGELFRLWRRYLSSASEPRATAATSSAASDVQKLSGGYIEEAIPDPIPNSEVKLFGADGTAWVTVWESRTLPGYNEAPYREVRGFTYFVLSTSPRRQRLGDYGSDGERGYGCARVMLSCPISSAMWSSSLEAQNGAVIVVPSEVKWSVPSPARAQRPRAT